MVDIEYLEVHIDTFSLFNAPLTIGLAKVVSEKRKRKKTYYQAALFGCTMMSLIASAILILVAPQISDFLNIHDTSIVVYLAIVLPFAVFYNMTIFYFRGLYRMKASATSDIALNIIRILALLLFFLIGYLHTPYLAFLASFVILEILLIFFGKVNFRTLKTKVNEKFKLFKSLLLYSMPIFIGESLKLFGLGFDRLFLTRFFTTFASGIYDIAIALCMGYMVIANSYGMALLPVASKNQKNLANLKRNLIKTLTYVAVLYIVYTIPMLLLAEPVISLINPQYLFVLNFYFVPELKYLGAVVAMLISATLSVITLSLLVWRRFRLKK